MFHPCVLEIFENLAHVVNQGPSPLQRQQHPEPVAAASDPQCTSQTPTSGRSLSVHFFEAKPLIIEGYLIARSFCHEESTEGVPLSEIYPFTYDPTCSSRFRLDGAATALRRTTLQLPLQLSILLDRQPASY